ncbi:hypothetical protein OS119_27510, partial [Klebsiella pneumoniae]|uniref:hypothetical protein n=1 Tax=Klebsiella pneumoniae TaxID=573 RepID=UPI00237A8E06
PLLISRPPPRSTPTPEHSDPPRGPADLVGEALTVLKAALETAIAVALEQDGSDEHTSELPSLNAA